MSVVVPFGTSCSHSSALRLFAAVPEDELLRCDLQISKETAAPALYPNVHVNVAFESFECTDRRAVNSSKKIREQPPIRKRQLMSSPGLIDDHSIVWRGIFFGSDFKHPSIEEGFWNLDKFSVEELIRREMQYRSWNKAVLAWWPAEHLIC